MIRGTVIPGDWPVGKHDRWGKSRDLRKYPGRELMNWMKDS